MKTIALTKGMVAIVDDDDFAMVSCFQWHALRRRNKWHAARTANGRSIYMHRVLLNAPPDREVDHANGDGLDNRRFNLRLATKRQNAQNRRSGDPRKASQFHGVSLHPRGNRWRVLICAGEPDKRGNAKQVYVGHFIDEVEAARAYDRAAIKHFGAFALTNFPKEEYES